MQAPNFEIPPLTAVHTRLDLTPQIFETFDRSKRRTQNADLSALWRRIVIFGGAFAITAYMGNELWAVLALGDISSLEVALITLFIFNMFWLALFFMTALAGFAVTIFGMRRLLIDHRDYSPSARLSGKTAILVSTCNDPPARVFSKSAAMMKELAELGHQHSFDLFVLSETADPDIWIQEEAVFHALREGECRGMHIYYWHRPGIMANKVRNIAQWCRSWGASYDYMLPLDANSMMSGDAIAKLAAIIEGNPNFGLVQTLPISIGSTTLFGYLRQFAGRLSGPMMAAGLAFWQRNAGSFWGHNAIVRRNAFVENAIVPARPGKSPSDGPTLSSNCVEAALLSRAGWQVCLVPDLEGSYSPYPQDLIDFATRDRRQSQVSLGYARALLARGLRCISRVNLAIGISNYLSALFWLLFFLIIVVITLQSIFMPPQYFTEDFSLFPNWPMRDDERVLNLLALTLGLVVAPRGLAYLNAVADRKLRRGCGGILALSASVLAETLFAALLAPVITMQRATAVVYVLRGKNGQWEPLRNEEKPLSFRESMKFLSVPMTFGAAVAVLALYSSLTLFLWVLPVTFPLIISALLSFWTAKPAAGEWFLRRGLFRTEEERTPPAIAQQAAHIHAKLKELPLEREAISELAQNAGLRMLHLALLQAQPIELATLRSTGLATARAKLQAAASIEESLSLLKPEEKAELLSDRDCFSCLFDRIAGGEVEERLS